MNEGGYVVCCCPNLRRDWTVPEEVGYVNEGVGAPGAIGISNIHSLDKSHRDFRRSHSKTYENTIFSKSFTVRIYYVSHNDFRTDLKIICCTFRKKW